MIPRIGFHPRLVVVGALAEYLLINDRQAENWAEELDHLFRPGQATEVAVNDDAVEALVYESE
jgi:hypothetical protein